jgi:hypothetical protein
MPFKQISVLPVLTSAEYAANIGEQNGYVSRHCGVHNAGSSRPVIVVSAT